MSDPKLPKLPAGAVRLPISSFPKFPTPTLTPCAQRSMAATNSLAAQDNHWWQNWGKTHAYVCQRMMFPTSVDEVGAAIRIAEAENVPVRAVGGGWSFSDVYLPGDVTTPRPYALGVDAIAQLVPLAKTFSRNPRDPVIASIPPATSPSDDRDSLRMFNPAMNDADRAWRYLGNGNWEFRNEPVTTEFVRQSLMGFVFDIATGTFNLPPTGAPRPFRPIAKWGDKDVAGSLVMFDDATGTFLRDVFYNGNGMWTFQVLDTNPELLRLNVLLQKLTRSVRVRRSTPAFALSLLSPPPQRVYLINTDSLASSLQQHLPNILAPQALRQTAPDAADRRHYFHVEAGIKMEALSQLLARQSPPLALEATSGSPGATLAGMLATATHGGEYNLPLLVDRVKAVHLVGPGGLQWWIEGAEPIADPEKLIHTYPCLSRERIVSGTSSIGGLAPQDWLNAVVVSMGCIGVIYSLVIEVVPSFGIHQVVVQTTWRRLLGQTIFRGHRLNPQVLRDPSTSPGDRRALGQAIFEHLANGHANGTGIPADRNEYIDLAIDPNPILGSSGDLLDADFNCWVLNRERTATVPFEAKPVPRDLIGRIGTSLAASLRPDDIADRFAQHFNVDFIRRLEGDLFSKIDGFFRAIHQLPHLQPKIERLVASADVLDTALDILTAPIDAADDGTAARAVVSGFFAGLLGVENGRAESTDAALRVGEIGFPASGIMGTGLEIAMAPEEAFVFLQTDILDRVREPIFGYVSLRICPRTAALLGMQQFDPSVMIELVAFGTAAARRFVAGVQLRTVNRILTDHLNAMFHWGLENSLVTAAALRSVPVLNEGRPSKLEKFRTVRSLIKAAAATAPPVFENAFTRRLNL